MAMRGQAKVRSRTDRQVTQPSSFWNSLMSTIDRLVAELGEQLGERGASAAISSRPSPRSTTWAPDSSGTGRNRSKTAGSSTSGG